MNLNIHAQLRASSLFQPLFLQLLRFHCFEPKSSSQPLFPYWDFSLEHGTSSQPQFPYWECVVLTHCTRKATSCPHCNYNMPLAHVTYVPRHVPYSNYELPRYSNLCSYSYCDFITSSQRAHLNPFPYWNFIVLSMGLHPNLSSHTGSVLCYLTARGKPLCAHIAIITCPWRTRKVTYVPRHVPYSGYFYPLYSLSYFLLTLR